MREAFYMDLYSMVVDLMDLGVVYKALFATGQDGRRDDFDELK
jgi:hypothetical protein